MSDERVLASIKLNGQEYLGGPFRCGCEQRGKRWFFCSYHEGYGDGLDAETNGVRAEEET